MNTFANGEWGKEERKSNPIKKGDSFDIRIRAHDDRFQKKAKRFNVNLLRRNGDIALHFNPRFDEKTVIRNALAANEWGNEEREGKMPFEKGVGFDLAIKNEPYAFQ
ncbi:unnamed protein product, partial [Cylicostephanus goldi]